MSLSRRDFIKGALALSSMATMELSASPLLRSVLREQHSYQVIYQHPQWYQHLLNFMAAQFYLFEDIDIHAKAQTISGEESEEMLVFARLQALLAEHPLNLALTNQQRFSAWQAHAAELFNQHLGARRVQGYMSIGLPHSDYDPVQNCANIMGPKVALTNPIAADYLLPNYATKVGTAGVEELPLAQLEQLTKHNAGAFDCVALHQSPERYSSAAFTTLLGNLHHCLSADGILATRLYDVSAPLQSHFAAVIADWQLLLEGQSWQQALTHRARQKSLSGWQTEFAAHGFSETHRVRVNQHAALPEYVVFYQKVS
ncbi:hypothetical protein ACFOEE_08915 [Pseudoalteromonas fenneropenaei]|uniref:Uncharacterized protein n=1 Tax=Pseudoalteromonas fenneropenaei TaxID=1737459 RepID=A0ABV7CJ13_9GAMM